MLQARLVRQSFSGVALAVTLFAATGCSGPRGTREPWVYAISRNAYGAMSDSTRTISPTAGERNQEGVAMFMAALIVLPFAIDTVLLPITLPHDLLFVI